MFDDDDFMLGVLLPWPLALVLLLIVIPVGIWYWSLPVEEKTALCSRKAEPYHVESRYDEHLGCLVRLDPTHWQKIEKFEKSGVVEVQP